MRKLFGVIAVVGLVLAIGQPVGAAEKGKLKVATSLPAPGFWNGDSPQTLDGGLEWAMAADIAEELGYSGVTYSNV